MKLGICFPSSEMYFNFLFDQVSVLQNYVKNFLMPF